MDLLTTFAPGDNFRVAAWTKPGLSDIDAEKLLNESLDPHKVTVNGAAPLVSVNIRLTNQLAVWRRLWIEDDTTNSLRNLMQPGTVNRQDNRFADAFLEPNYFPAALTATSPTVTSINFNNLTGRISRAGDDAIYSARDTKALESPVFWVAYITDKVDKIEVVTNPGMTINDLSVVTGTPKTNAYEASLVFAADIAIDPRLTPANALIVMQKVAIHEVAHQVVRDWVHRGDADDIKVFLRTANKGRESFRRTMNIMNEDAPAIPLNNPNADPMVGPFDFFYFTTLDLAKMRKRMNSPGTVD